MTPHLNRLVETVQMRGHTIGFYSELMKLSRIITKYSLLSRALVLPIKYTVVHVLKRKRLRSCRWCTPENKRGPSIIPCGTPDATAGKKNVFASRTTCWFLSARKLLIQDRFFCLWCRSGRAFCQAMKCRTLSEVQQNCVNLLFCV